MLYLYYMYEFQQQKSQRYPTLQQRLASNSSALDVPPTPRSKKPSSWSDFSLLASAKRIAAWHHDTKVIFENLPHLFWVGWKVELPRRWFENQTVWLSLWVTILVFQFLLESYLLRWKLLSEENFMNWILRSSQIKYIHLPNHSNAIYNCSVLSNLDRPWSW